MGVNSGTIRKHNFFVTPILDQRLSITPNYYYNKVSDFFVDTNLVENRPFMGDLYRNSKVALGNREIFNGHVEQQIRSKALVLFRK